MTSTTAEQRVVLERWRSSLALVAREGTSPHGRWSRSALAQLLSSEAGKLELATSRFRADSELSRVNGAAGSWVPVSWYFVRVLTTALDAAEASDGAVDPCLGGLADLAGYRVWRDGATGAASTARPGIVSRPGSWREVEIRPAAMGAQVRIPSDAALDLGAVAKAWLADLLAVRLADQGCSAVADMGGDIRAISHDQPWVLGVAGESGEGSRLLSITDAGLATSGRDRRRWAGAASPVGSEDSHHIIDPRTGRPARTPWWTASVLADTAVAANIGATAAMVLGHAAPQWLGEQGLDALLVAAEGAVPVAAHDNSPSRARLVGAWPMSQAAR